MLLALDRYFDDLREGDAGLRGARLARRRYAGEHAFKGRTTERQHVEIPMKLLAGGAAARSDLVIAKDGRAGSTTASACGTRRTDLKLRRADHGFVVERRYEGADDPAT